MVYIHIAEMNPDVQQGDDCEFNCIECPYLEDVKFVPDTKEIYVKCKNS